MRSKKSSINVPFSKSDIEIIELISKKKKMNVSSLIKKIVKEWIEDYEDFILSKQADEAYKRWKESGYKAISSEDVWKKIDL